jgi:hypothetical protein
MTIAELRGALAAFHGDQEALVRLQGEDGPDLVPILEVRRTIDPDTGADIIVVET